MKTAVVVATKAMAVAETQLVRVEHRVVFRVSAAWVAWALLLSESLLNGHMDKEDQLEGDKVLAAPGGGTQNSHNGLGGAGGGSWARKSVSQGGTLPTIYNINGSGFSISDAGQSQVVITFEAISTTSCTSSCQSVSGTVDGMADTDLVVQNNAGDFLSISENGDFTFPTALGDGSSYAVTIFQQPDNQTCRIINGSGIIQGGDIHDVGISCVDGGSASSRSVQALTGIYKLDGFGYVSIQEKGDGGVIVLSLSDDEVNGPLFDLNLPRTWAALFGVRKIGAFDVVVRSVVANGANIEARVVQISPDLIQIEIISCTPWAESSMGACMFASETAQTFVKVF